MPASALTLRVAGVLAAVALTVSLVPSSPALAAPDYDVENPHFIPLDDQPDSVVVSADGRRLYGASGDIDGAGILTVVDLVSGSLVTQKRFADGVGDVAVSPDGRRVYFTHGGPNWLDECFVTELDASTLRVLRDLKLGQRCRDLILSRTGKTIFVSDNSNVLFVSVKTGAVRRSIWVPQGPGDLALSPDGATLFATGPSDDQIHRISVHSETLWSSTSLPTVSSRRDWINTLHMAPDGSTLYAIGDLDLYAIPLSGPGRTQRIPVPYHHGTSISRDGKRLYLSGEHLWIFDTTSSTVSRAPGEWGRSASALAESTDGRRLHLSGFGYLITLGATPSLVYPDRSLVATAGTSITPTRPVFRWGYSDPTYFVTPALPSGLRLNASTGVISGTPKRAQATKTYTVYTAMLNADTNKEERTKASVTIRIATRPTAARIALSRTSQKYRTTAPATLYAAVSPAIAGTFRVYDGSTRIASVSTKTGKLHWKLPRTLRVGTHKLKVVFVPSNRDVYRADTSASRTFTVKR